MRERLRPFYVHLAVAFLYLSRIMFYTYTQILTVLYNDVHCALSTTPLYEIQFEWAEVCSDGVLRFNCDNWLWPTPLCFSLSPSPSHSNFRLFRGFCTRRDVLRSCCSRTVHDWNTRWQSTTSAFCVIRFYKLIPMGQLRIRVEKKRKTGQLFANWAIWHFLHKYTRGYFSFSAQAKSRLMPRKMQTRCYFSFWILREVRGG